MGELEIAIDVLKSNKLYLRLKMVKPSEFGRWPSDSDFDEMIKNGIELQKVEAQLFALEEVLESIKSNSKRSKVYEQSIGAQQLTPISVDDKQFLIEWCEQQIRSNILDAKTYYGGDTSQEARARNHERQDQSKKDVVKFQRLMDFFYGLGEIKQQSPAVAAPETETVYFRYANSRIESTICVPKGEAHKHVDPKLIIKIVPHTQSPRITEQDGREKVLLEAVFKLDRATEF